MLFRKPLPCFYSEIDSKESYSIIKTGLRVIDINKIVGTVDKCNELDSRFRYLKRGDIGEYLRREQIDAATNPFKFLPPIEVNKYKERYYVIDGHRRVASALKQRIDFIDAEITEYILQKDKDSRTGFIARRRFESETGIKHIRLNRDENYLFLISEIEVISNGNSFEEKARFWASEYFFPLCREIEKSELVPHYPDLAVGDIYVLMVSFYKDFMGGIPGNMSYATIISGYLFAHQISHRRSFRLLRCYL
jgi:hypothetical protein